MSKKKSAYGNIGTKSFQAGIIQLLENEYKMVGSHKIIKLIADDIEQLHRKFFPDEHQREPGEIIWRTTSIKQNKPPRGTTIADHKTTTVKLPYITKEDVKLKEEGISSTEHDRRRIKRLSKAAYNQGGMLNQQELAALLNRSRSTISKRIREIQKNEEIVLPLKGALLDLGRGTTHKGAILKLYEQNVAPPEIARRTYHEVSSVDRYIKDYERIKLLMKKGFSRKEICKTTGKSETLVEEYAVIIHSYYPDLAEDSDEKPLDNSKKNGKMKNGKADN